MGEALVTHSPDWKIMNHEKTEKWWFELMQGKTWYATNLNTPGFFSNIHFQPNESKPLFVSKL